MYVRNYEVMELHNYSIASVCMCVINTYHTNALLLGQA